MTAVFINYRRDDSLGHAGRLSDHLTKHFGDGAVFIDIGGIEPGDDVQNRIEQAVKKCQVFLTVIGKQWLTINDQYGKRRLDNPDDFVRLEIAAALKTSARIIPVLIEGATMPRAAELPDDIKGLARFNAHRISEYNFADDVAKLIQTIEKAVQPSQSPIAKTPIPMPKLRQEFTDKQRKDFLYQSFMTIKSYFKSALEQLERSYPDVESSFVEVNNFKFTCEIFVQGKSKNRCKIWVGSRMREETIGYVEGRFDTSSDSSWNEIISVEHDEDKMYLQVPLTGSFYHSSNVSSQPSPQEAAEILWMRFTRPLT